jgi:hypothetical protein
LNLNDEKVGRVTKQWSGVTQEVLSDADNFGINFPLDLDVKVKGEGQHQVDDERIEQRNLDYWDLEGPSQFVTVTVEFPSKQEGSQQRINHRGDSSCSASKKDFSIIKGPVSEIPL